MREAAAIVAPVPAELDVIPLRCELNNAGPLPWLDIPAYDADNLPSRVRVFEPDGNVICVSDPTIYGGAARSAPLKLPLPPDLASAVRRGALDDLNRPGFGRDSACLIHATDCAGR